MNQREHYYEIAALVEEYERKSSRRWTVELWIARLAFVLMVVLAVAAVYLVLA